MNETIHIQLEVESDGSEESDTNDGMAPEVADEHEVVSDMTLLFGEVLQRGAFVSTVDGDRRRTSVEDAPRPETLALSLGFGDIGEANSGYVRQLAVKSDLFVYVEAGVSSRDWGVFVDWDVLKDTTGIGGGYIESQIAAKKQEATTTLDPENVVNDL